MIKTKIIITDKQNNVSEILSSFLKKNVEILNKKNGAPYIVGENEYISVSHKRRYNVVAVSPRNVGVDIELIDEKDSIFKIADKYFGEKIEYKNYADFYRSWTKKESLGKLLEKGITKKLLSLDTSNDVYKDEENEPIYFNHFYFGKFVVTVADYTNDVEFVLDIK